MTCRPKKRRTRLSIIINNITYNIAVAIPKTNAHLKSNIFPCCVSFSLLYLCGHLTKVACDKFKTLSVCQESIVNHSFISMSQASLRQLSYIKYELFCLTSDSPPLLTSEPIQLKPTVKSSSPLLTNQSLVPLSPSAFCYRNSMNGLSFSLSLKELVVFTRGQC